MPNYTAAEVGLQSYQDAKAFWQDWHEDPDAQEHFGATNGYDVVVPGLIRRHSQHPDEARWIAKEALASVLEQSRR